MNETSELDTKKCVTTNIECINPENEKMEDEEELSKYLLDRMKELETRNALLKEQYDKIESEKRYIENQKVKYEREVRRMQTEIDRIKTTPLVVATVIDKIDDNKILVKSSTGPQFLVGISQFIDEKLLLPGTNVALNQQTLAIVNILPSVEEPIISAMEVLNPQDVDYNNIGGLHDQIQEIIEAVELPLLKPEAFEKIGITPPKGLLLFGQPGTGKTLLAKAVAHRTNATFIRVVGSELIQKYIGDGAKLVRDIFAMARKKAPTILFIDELDAVAARRLNDTNGADREVQRTLMQLLSEMDGFENRGEVSIIAATNRLDVLDPAILRPGRFDRIINIPMPNEISREAILKIHTRYMNIVENIDYNKLAVMTEGVSGAQLNAIATEAGMFAIREDKDQVEMDHFLKAIKKVVISEKDPLYVVNEKIETMFG